MIPQAYTMRDVTDAYRWAQSLPPSVRDELKSVEALVSAFIKTKRLNHSLPSAAPMAPAGSENMSRSAQDFQKALKDLQPELNQFDFSPGPVAQAPAPVQTQVVATKSAATQPTQPVAPKMAVGLLNPEELDGRSKAIIKDLRDHLNLSTDVEAIRVCIALAEKQVKNLLGL